MSYVYFYIKKNKLLNNVLPELYRYFIDKELQHRDDPIVCLAHVMSCLSKKKLIHDGKLSICSVVYHFKVNYIVNNSLHVFIHFSEEIVSKL
jgi:hypothetical protein